MKTLGILSVATVLALSTTAIAADQTLFSSKASSPIILDGLADKAWDAAKTITVTVDETPYEPNNGYKGMDNTKVNIRSEERRVGKESRR